MTRDQVEGMAAARGALVLFAAELLIAGLVLAVVSDHFTVGHFIAPVLVGVGGGLLVRIWHVTRAANPNRCRVSEEWCGIFIGRRACSTHGTRWDDGGPCPASAPSNAPADLTSTWGGQRAAEGARTS